MNKKIIISTLAIALVGMSSSCNKFLDTLPDKRTELNSRDKIRELLVSAYPTLHRAGIIEQRTDNVQDNGTLYEDDNLAVRQNYMWQWHTETDWDTSKGLWEACYSSIAAANQALKTIEEMGTPEELKPSKGEALFCRAWGHYLLLTTFSQAYNSQTSATDKGMPYFSEPEKSIHIKATRLSVKESYERIERDLLEGYPLIDNTNYGNATLKYHFNKRAAAAFMTEFFLAMEKWEEAKKYADLALGRNITAELRNLANYNKFTNSREYAYGFMSANEPANLMLQATRSLWGRWQLNLRYGHANAIARTQTLRSRVPGNIALPVYDKLYYLSSSEPMVYLPKMEEVFEITNVLAQTGTPRIVCFPFTVDKTLLMRAEAETLLGQYEAAAQDLSMWYQSKGGKAVTLKDITDFYAVPELPASASEEEQRAVQIKLATICKPLNPRFAQPLQKGTQYDLMQAVLHAKRILTVHEGNRWDDIKRYGIEITHELVDGTKLVLTAHDARKAIQIPADIITAGLEPNTY